MNTFRRHSLNVLVMGVAVLLFALPLMAQQGEETVEPVTTVTDVVWSEDLTSVPGAEAMLTRMEHGVSMTLDTRGLEPGDVYTIWWVIFNLPENCSDDECGQNDVFMMDNENNFILDGNNRRQLNRAGIDAAQISILWAAGSIVDEDGTAMFQGRLPIGDTTGDVQFGPGLLNPMGADVHLVARTHGPAQPGMLREQLFTQWGGCPDPDNRLPCQNMQNAFFVPPA